MDETLGESPTPMVLRNLQSDGSDNDVGATVATVLSNIFLFFLIFGLSATVSLKSLQHKLHNKCALILGCTMQFIVMPFLGWLSVMSFKSHGFTQAMGLTLLVVTSSPGGSYSNLWCSLFNADLALSVAMTAVSTLLSIFMLPGNLLMYSYFAYGAQENIVEALDFGALFTSLGIVIAAISSGLYVADRVTIPNFHTIANRLGSLSGLALILVSAFLSGGTGSDGTDSFWQTAGWSFYIGVLLPCLGGIILSNALASIVQLAKPEQVSVSVECSYQNTGIATSVAVTMFDDSTERMQAVAIPLLYGIVEAVVIGSYCIAAWKVGWTKAPADEDVCTVMTNSYEHDDEPEEEEARDHSKPLTRDDDDGDDDWGRQQRRGSHQERRGSQHQHQEKQQRQRRVSHDYRVFGPTGTRTVTSSRNITVNNV